MKVAFYLALTDIYVEILLNLLKNSQKCDKVNKKRSGGVDMAVSYKKLQHLMIEREVTNAQLMREANISANIITKIKTGQYIALDKLESICCAMKCTPNDILDFIPNTTQSEEYDNV